jgi:hypothetical protein
MIPEKIVNSLYCSLGNEKHILENPGLNFYSFINTQLTLLDLKSYNELWSLLLQKMHFKSQSAIHMFNL